MEGRLGAGDRGDWIDRTLIEIVADPLQTCDSQLRARGANRTSLHLPAERAGDAARRIHIRENGFATSLSRYTERARDEEKLLVSGTRTTQQHDTLGLELLKIHDTSSRASRGSTSNSLTRMHAVL